MQKTHIALCQGHWTGDQKTTIELYSDLIDKAVRAGANLVCLPEFSILPYFPGIRNNPESSRWQETLREGATARFCSDFAKTYEITIIGSIFERDDDNLWDTAVIYGADGQLKHYTRKVHIPSGEGYHETDYFRSEER